LSGKPPTHVQRVLAASLLMAAMLLLPLPASAGLAWDAGAIIGYAATIFALLLYLYPLRGAGADGAALPHRRLFTVTQHKRFGWIALGLACLHALITLIAQPLTVHYFYPSAPFYMLCGTAALVALGVLVPTGLTTRSSMRRAAAPRLIAAVHAATAALLLALLGAHIIGSGQLIDTPVKAVAACVLFAIPLLWAALRSRSQPPRRGYRVAMSLMAVAGAALLLLPLGTPARLLEPVIRAPDPMPVHFPHELHTSVNCVTCHHNFHDNTGTGSCVDCHRSSRNDLPHSSLTTFHMFCRDCHSERAREGLRHGPPRECQPCHHGG